MSMRSVIQLHYRGVLGSPFVATRANHRRAAIKGKGTVAGKKP
jgi:hypothetical protein